MTDTRKRVYDILSEEREYQDEKWGGSIHDKSHTLGEWLLFIRKYLNDAENAMYDGDEEAAKNAIRKITALGIASMEVINVPKRSEL